LFDSLKEGKTMEKVWVVTMWQDDEGGSGFSYVWKVCATKEKAYEYASQHPLWTHVEEYEVEE
jgi:hypothetical protein